MIASFTTVFTELRAVEAGRCRLTSRGKWSDRVFGELPKFIRSCCSFLSHLPELISTSIVLRYVQYDLMNADSAQGFMTRQDHEVYSNASESVYFMISSSRCLTLMTFVTLTLSRFVKSVVFAARFSCFHVVLFQFHPKHYDAE